MKENDKVAFPYLGLNKILINDFRRYRNWVDENVSRVNETHCRAEMDAKSLKTLAKTQKMEELALLNTTNHIEIKNFY